MNLSTFKFYLNFYFYFYIFLYLSYSPKPTIQRYAIYVLTNSKKYSLSISFFYDINSHKNFPRHFYLNKT